MLKPQLRRLPIAVSLSIISFSLLGQASFAQNAIAPDTTLPNNTLVNFNSADKIYTITGGTQVGTTQFHSFQDFSVPSRNTAHFDNALTTENVIGRVTGANISNIEGMLKTNGATNLYLINPNGIVFGANAKLNINGSFSASTANRINFSDGSEFSASDPQAPPSLLNVNVPVGLQYGASNTGATIVNRGNLAVGQDLVLNADNLDLQGKKLQAGGNLTLQAQDTVLIRDAFFNPFTAEAGGNLLVQGNQSIDIFTLRDPYSIFESGGDLVLRSLYPIFADINFSSAGNFRVEQLDGTSNNLLSRNGGVIFANGDVSLADYYGGSLHILAGGSVTLGDIFITNTGAQDSTINPSNSTLFNATKTYADLSRFYLTDYQATKNSDGSVKDVSPVQTLITIDGSTQATLDIRAGIDWGKLGGLPTSPTSLGIVKPAPTYTNTPTSADITVNGGIRIEQPNGLVLLTNQFTPNTLQGAIAINGSIDVSAVDTSANGGDIRVYGRGNITVGSDLGNNAIALFSASTSFSSDSGNGGLISIASDTGYITLFKTRLNTYSLFNTRLNTYSFSNFGKSGNGGAISLSTYSGNIIVDSSDLNSSSTVETFPYTGEASNGGAISLVSHSGHIILDLNSSLNSSSNSDNGSTKDGGDIALVSYSGNITLQNSLILDSSSNGEIGNGGKLSLATNSGNISLTESAFYTSSYSRSSNAGNGGDISLRANSGNITIGGAVLNSTSLTDSGQAGNGGVISLISNTGHIDLQFAGLDSSSAAETFSQESGSYVVGEASNGGSIYFKSNSGNITLSDTILDSTSRSDFGNSANGGAISFLSDSGNITIQYFAISELSLKSYAYSKAESYLQGNTGNGGAISFQTNTGNIQLDNAALDSSAFSFSGNPQNGGAISFVSNTGNLTLNFTTLDSRSFSNDPNTITQNGGAIVMTTDSGNIRFHKAVLDTRSQSNYGISGDGGSIFLDSKAGNISLNASGLISSAFSVDGVAGNGGTLSLSAANGSIISDPTNTSFLISVGVSQTGAISGNGGKVTLTAKNQMRDLEIFTLSSSGKAGKVEINGTGDLTITNLQISTSKELTIPDPFNPNQKITFDTGKIGSSGDIAIAGLGRLTFSNSLFNTATQGIAPAGNILITSPSAIAFQNSQVFSNTNSIGDAGVITVTAGTELAIQDRSNITAITSALIPKAGNAGNINFTAPILKITDGSLILAGTNGAGAGGNITINAPTSVSLTREQNIFPILSVQTNGAGKAGNILIDTPTLTLSDQARITATATATSTNRDGGGSITLNASTMNLFGTVGVFAETKGVAPAGTLFLNPYSSDSSLNITLAPNSQISASTSGSGNGGSIFVAAPEAIAITGQGKLAVETSGTGNAGNIRFTTGNLTLSDGVLVSASTSGAGKAGDISIQANNLTLSNGASIQTTTSSTGDSGKIDVIAANSFMLTGTGSGLFANTEQDSTGKGGSIFVDPPLVSITNGAGISVNSLGTGNGGNIDVFAGKFVFADIAFLKANTASGEGGNINLQISDIFFPRNNSSLTATAGGTGNGGNINLSSLFTIAIPSENSDIFANAFFGKGGNINITTQGLFGIEFHPRLTNLSDITASSEFGLQGNVNINTPGVDPSKGLTNLPTNVSDPSRLITQSCIADHRNSEFIITGKGGIPTKPSDRPIYATVLDNFGSLPNHSLMANFNAPILETAGNTDAIVEATGWVVNAKNQVVLVAGAIPSQSRTRCSETSKKAKVKSR